jgi:cell division protein FtsB
VSRRRLLGVAAGTMLALGLAAYGTVGALRVRAMQQELRAIERDMATLREQARKLNETVEKLRHDPASIEKIAREELGYVRQGETILKFPSSQSR